MLMYESMRGSISISRERRFRFAARVRSSLSGWARDRRGGLPAIAFGAVLLALRPVAAIADPPSLPTTPVPTAPAPAAPVPTAPPPIDPAKLPATLTPFAGSTAIEDRLDAAGRVVIGGDRLNEHLVRRFYAGHGWEPVWGSHPEAIAALLATILRADQHGLDPVAFHSRLLAGDRTTLSPVERDLLLSDAILSYADALAEGAMPFAERSQDEDLRPAPVDVVAIVDATITNPDPGQAIEALAPVSPDYLALQRAYVDYVAIAAGNARVSGLGVDGVPRLSVAEALRRARQIAINLERLRWLPRDLPADRLVVDTAVQQLQLFRADQLVFTTRVVAGEVDKQTPELQPLVTDVLFNPPWNVPPSIFRKEIQPKLAANHNYLAQHHMRWHGNSVQQEAGPYSALGRLKFEMNDPFDVYLHDTPEKWRFQAADRMMSHGCVRVENPRLLASLLLDESLEQIDKGIAVDRTHSRALPKPLPVFIVYRTAVPESDGKIAFRGDPYGRDAEIWAYLSRARQVPLAQKSLAHSTVEARAGVNHSTIGQKTATLGDSR
jgi:L,D-transpeptidase YcbB